MKKLKQTKPYIYIIPISLIIVSFYVIPIISSFFISLSKTTDLKSYTFSGFENYSRAIKDEYFQKAILNTIFYTVFTVPIQTTLALIFALIANKNMETKTGKFFKTAVFMPVISSLVLVAVVWRVFLNAENSFINQLIYFFTSSNISWFDAKFAKMTIIMISTWKNIGYFMIIFMAALSKIPKSIIESARIDGCSEFKIFSKIKLPLIYSSIVLVLFLSSLWSLQMFDLVYVLTGGGPGTSSISVVLRIYNAAFKEYDFPFAMSMANLLLLVVAIFTIIQNKFIVKDR